MDYFDKDDLIEHCDDSSEMDEYIATKCNDAVNDYIKDNPPQDKEEIIRQLQDGMKYKFREFLCDLVDANYHITDEELLNELKQRL